MTKSELNKYRNVLEAKQAELVQLVRNRDGIAIEKSPDALDEVALAPGACDHTDIKRAPSRLAPAVDDLFDRSGDQHEVEVQFVTRYALPPATVETLTWLLRDISPRTVAAMQSFEHVPDLF